VLALPRDTGKRFKLNAVIDNSNSNCRSPSTAQTMGSINPRHFRDFVKPPATDEA